MNTAGILLLAVLLPLTARAEEGGSGACRADVQKYCSAQGDRGKTMDCLLDHQQEMTQACYDFLKSQLQRQRGTQEAQPRVASAAAASRPIYKVTGADGRIVYTNAPPAGGSLAEEIRLDRVISAVPIRSSER